MHTERAPIPPLLRRTSILPQPLPPDSICPNHLPEAPLLIASHWGLGLQYMPLGGGDKDTLSDFLFLLH